MTSGGCGSRRARNGRPARCAGLGRSAMADGYANALRSRLPDATSVVDHFHAVKLANSAIDDVRRRVQQEQKEHRGRSGDPLCGIRRLLLVGAERLSERGWDRIHAGFAAGRPRRRGRCRSRGQGTAQRCVLRRWRPFRSKPAGQVLHPLRRRGRSRADPPGQDRPFVRTRDPRLPPQRTRKQRPHRSNQPRHRNRSTHIGLPAEDFGTSTTIASDSYSPSASNGILAPTTQIRSRQPRFVA